ncbi:type I polyketide synthase [Mycobacterium sp. Dal123C01]|uniref:type I polyketide synthase n=1 Tax=Mycobacterium sp. Dal123C01 TaxID=3457577 RepID=UPI00403EF1C5
MATPVEPIHQILRRRAELDPGRTAFSDQRRAVTYGSFYERTGNIAAHLAINGLQPGGRVALCLGNRVEMLEAFYAVLRAAAVVVPLNPSLTQTELHHQLSDSGAEWIVTEGTRLPGLVPTLKAIPSIRVLVVGPMGDVDTPLGKIDFPALDLETIACKAVGNGPPDNPQLDVTAFLLYTSGTTGAPKGVRWTLRSSLWSAANSYISVFGLDRNDHMLWPLPLFHSLAVIFANLATVIAGAHTHVLDGVNTDAVLTALTERDYTLLAGVPTMYHYLADAVEARGAINLHALRACLSAGAPVTTAMKDRFTQVLAVPMIDSYGSTEAGGPITITRPGDEPVPGSCGHVVPGLEICIVDADTREQLPSGADGEILVRGPSVMLGYHHRDQATREVLNSEGWYSTGDLGVLDEQGNLYLRGRVRELIIRGGQNIYPGEIENILSGHDWISEVAVVGQSHPALGEVPVAAVIPRQPLSVDEFKQRVRESIAACRQELTAYKVPVDIVTVEAIPRTATGKIKRHELRNGLEASEPKDEQSTTRGADPVLAAAWVERLAAGVEGINALKATLEDVMTEVLNLPFGAPELALHQPFGALGFNSLLGVELHSRLVAVTGLELPGTVIYDQPTPMALLGYLESLLTSDARQPKQPQQVRILPSVAEPIAIIGMACRFPGGVASPEQLWKLIATETDAIGPFPADRGWDLESLLNPSGGQGASATASGGFLENVAGFDPQFFDMSPREALATDPQQRLLLELAWEAAERAGIAPDSLRDTATGVFVGLMYHDYGDGVDIPDLTGYRGIGVAGSVASGRIAYKMGLRGPAVTIDTACSSSLVAVHLATRSLRSGECDMALAGGVAVMATPATFVEFSIQGGLSGDGRCKAFAAGANGTGWSEGAGLLMLQRLSDARREGRSVLAVIDGSAINQDGASNGLSAPSGPAQEEVIRSALADAGIRADEVDVVEAHGTGTMLGDPIEANAVLNTYGQGRGDGSPVLLGSLKSNIGHAQSAAGVGAIIKMVQALLHEQAPRTLHAEQPTPHVNWSKGAVQLLNSSHPWKAIPGRVRRAGVSSFGVSGTNAHIILAENPSHTPTTYASASPSTQPGSGVVSAHTVPWVLSAKSAAALRGQAARLARLVAGDLAMGIADVAWSLISTRAMFAHRAVVLAADRGAFDGALRALAQGNSAPGVVTGTAATTVGGAGEVVFVFPGQGGQWVGMAQGLVDVASVFAESMTACAQALAPFVTWSLFEVLGDEDALTRVDVVQPVLWAVMVSLAALWRACGVSPAAVVGHSQGEIAAAVVAGALSLADGAKVVALRSQVLARLSGHGAMVSVALAEAEVRELLIALEMAGVAVAAVNGPFSVVVSGDRQELQALVDRWDEQGVWCRWLPVNYASHSPQTESLRESLESAFASVRWQASAVPLYSTVTGERVDTAQLRPDYWFTNLRRMVRFQPAIEALLAGGHRRFVEVSPHPVLTAAIEDCAGDQPIMAVGSLRRDESDVDQFLSSVAAAFTSGAEVDWARVIGRHARVELPTYSFDRQQYWIQPSASPHQVPQTHRYQPQTEIVNNGPMLGNMLRGGADTNQHAVLEVIQTQVAHVLGHSSPAAVDCRAAFKQLGFDSVSAMQLRNRLYTVTGLRLPTTLIFDHPTVAELAEHIRTHLPQTETESNSYPGQLFPEAFVNTVGKVFRRGDVELAFELCLFAAIVRREEELGTGSPDKLAATKIAQGPGTVALVCLPTFIAPAHVYQYSAFAEQFDGKRDVWFVPVPGYSEGEVLSNGLSDVVDSLADSVVEVTAGQRFCLLGHSGGGVLAHAVAERLHARNITPSAVVLVDTYFAADKLRPEFKAKLTERLFNGEVRRELVGATQLTAMAHYLNMFESWTPTTLPAVPSLFVRPAIPLSPLEMGMTRIAPQLCIDDVVVRGDHFSMFGNHADVAANDVNKWLQPLDNTG